MGRRSIHVDKEALETIDGRAPKRPRAWEQAQRGKGIVVTYRGIPKDVHEAVKGIAGKLGVPIGEVVRAFLEHGIDQYQSGALPLKPREKVTKSTLYPEVE